MSSTTPSKGRTLVLGGTGKTGRAPRGAARVAAAILAEPAPHVGRGRALCSGRCCRAASDRIRILSRAHRPVQYVEIEFEQFREALTRQMPDNTDRSDASSILSGRVLQGPLGQGLKRVGQQAGGIDEMLEVIPRITGVAPNTLQSFVRKCASQRWEELWALVPLRRMS
jgi:hypothetical protein